MARTSKKAKAVMLSTVADVATDAEIRSVSEAADAVDALPASELAAEAVAIEETEAAPASGQTVFIPLNKLKKSPRNARKTPHTEAQIDAYAGSIAAKGMFQNLVVEPELDAEGKPTGFYFVSIGEGRRLAQLLRAKRKEIKRTEPIRCVVDTANDPFEISLDENVTRADMHPADEFEAFRELAENRGWGAAEIAARFGVTSRLVKQRLKLGAVSPKLIKVYREGGLTLEQLQAFAITDDHARQEQVYANLRHNKDASIIRRDLTANNVPATDRRAIFIGAKEYEKAGGTIVRDLFTEDRGGYFADAALLNELVIRKLGDYGYFWRKEEGWKWWEAHIDFPHAHGFRRVYPHPVELPDEEEAYYAGLQEKYAALAQKWEGADELPPRVAKRLQRLDEEIQSIDWRRHAYDADDLNRGGLFVVLNHDGTPRIERGFIRPQDEAPEPEPEPVEDGETVIDGVRVNGDGEVIEDGEQDEDGNHASGLDAEDEEAEESGKPLSDLVIRDLTAHRTLALRVALGEQPDVALIAVTHALAVPTFYGSVEANCLAIRVSSAALAGHASGIADTPAAKALDDRHAAWASDMPRDVTDLWGFIAGLDQASVMALLAHCASLTVNAVRLPWEHRPRAQQTADRLATALALDMTTYWTPTEGSYFGSVTKAHILEAVREAVGDEAADRIAGMKKQPMAEAAEQLVAGSGWLPAVLRTAEPEWLTEPQADEEAEPEAALEDGAADDLPEPDNEQDIMHAEDAEAFPDAAE